MNQKSSQPEVDTPKVQPTMPMVRASTAFETAIDNNTNKKDANEEPQKSSRAEEKREAKLKKSLETQLQLQPLKMDASEFEGFAKTYCEKLTP